MIGFEAEPLTERGHPNEDPETRHLDKRELYSMLSHKFYLPPINSRGITREYLLRVFHNNCYRVPMLTLKHFEVELTSAMTRRIGLNNNSLLVRKLNILLMMRGLPDLGFDAFDPPEEVVSTDKAWLYRVARYIDQSNLLEFFEKPVVDEQPANSKSHVILQVHWGRIKAAKYFFRIEQARKDRKLWESFKAISQAYKSLLCQQLIVDKLKQDLEAATLKSADLSRSIEDQISKCAFTYTSLEDPRIRPELIINGSDNMTKEVRDQILLNCQLYSLL